MEVVEGSPAAILLESEFSRIPDKRYTEWRRVKTWQAEDGSRMELWANYITPGVAISGSHRFQNYLSTERSLINKSAEELSLKAFEIQLDR